MCLRHNDVIVNINNGTAIYPKDENIIWQNVQNESHTLKFDSKEDAEIRFNSMVARLLEQKKLV